MPALTDFQQFAFHVLRNSNNEFISTVGNVSSKTSDIFNFSDPLVDADGNVITAAFLLTLKTVNGTTEPIYIKENGLTADGTQTKSGFVIRGIKPSGNAVDAEGNPEGSSDFALDDIPEGSTVGIAIHAFNLESFQQVLNGEIGTGSDLLRLTEKGDSTAISVGYNNTSGTFTAFLRKNLSTNKAEISEDGTSWVTIDSLASHGTTSPIKNHSDVATAVSDSSVEGEFLVKGASEWENQAPATGSAFAKTPDATPANDENKVPVLNASGKGMEQFVDYATQAEMEAGTATDKPANALGVAQAIAEQAPNIVTVPQYIPSDDILEEYLPSVNTPSDTMEKIREIEIKFDCELRITYEVFTGSTGYVHQAQVYINGSPYGPVRNATSSPVSYSEDIVFSKGDLLQFYAMHSRVESGPTFFGRTYVQNIRLRGRVQPSSLNL